MSEDKQICTKEISISLPLSITRLCSLKIYQQQNVHGLVKCEVVVAEHLQEWALLHSYKDETIGIYFYYQGKDQLLFQGKIERVIFKRDHQFLIAEIHGISYTIELDQQKHCRTFQNTEMTYEEVVETVLSGTNSDFLWKTENPKIAKPLIQYEETDWEFLVRLASHFHNGLTAELKTSRAAFSFGLQQRQQKELANGQILEFGVADNYYEQGSYQNNHHRRHNQYLKLLHNELWEIGDFFIDDGSQYLVYQRELIYTQGELQFFYLAGASHVVYQKKQFIDSLRGGQLQGTVQKVEKENVYLQLDIDQQEHFEYPWPWVPETGNVSYCMPEVGTKVFLYFPTNQEADGVAIHGIRTNGKEGFYLDVKNREFLTMDRKKLGLYANQLLLEAKDGVSRVSLEDNSGIKLVSNGSIQMLATKGIQVVGSIISTTAPQQVVCQTSQSNIEICKNFNFYAPKGIKTKTLDKVSALEQETVIQPEDENGSEHESNQDNWQLNYAAWGSVPALDSVEQTSNALVDLELAVCGTVSKFAKGSTTVAVMEVMAGKQPEETIFPYAFQAMSSLTFEGGYQLPKINNQKTSEKEHQK